MRIYGGGEWAYSAYRDMAFIPFSFYKNRIYENSPFFLSSLAWLPGRWSTNPSSWKNKRKRKIWEQNSWKFRLVIEMLFKIAAFWSDKNIRDIRKICLTPGFFYSHLERIEFCRGRENWKGETIQQRDPIDDSWSSQFGEKNFRNREGNKKSNPKNRRFQSDQGYRAYGSKCDNKAVYMIIPAADGWARGSNDLGRGSNDLGRGSNDLGRGSNDLGRGINDLGRGSNDLGRGLLKYKLFNPWNAQKCKKSKVWQTDRQTDRRTDRHGGL